MLSTTNLFTEIVRALDRYKNELIDPRDHMGTVSPGNMINDWLLRDVQDANTVEDYEAYFIHRISFVSLNLPFLSQACLRLIMSLPVPIQLSPNTISDKIFILDSKNSIYRFEESTTSIMDDREINGLVSKILTLGNHKQRFYGAKKLKSSQFGISTYSDTTFASRKDGFYQIILQPVTRLLTTLMGVNFEVIYQKRYIFSKLPLVNKKVLPHLPTTPVFAVKEEFRERPFCLFDIQPHSIIPEGLTDNFDSMNYSSFNDRKLSELLKVLITQMMAMDIKYSILSDTYHILFLAIDLEKKDQIKGGPVVIPIKYRLLNNNSVAPSVLETMAAFLYKAYNDSGTANRLFHQVMNIQTGDFGLLFGSNASFTY